MQKKKFANFRPTYLLGLTAIIFSIILFSCAFSGYKVATTFVVLTISIILLLAVLLFYYNKVKLAKVITLSLVVALIISINGILTIKKHDDAYDYIHKRTSVEIIEIKSVNKIGDLYDYNFIAKFEDKGVFYNANFNLKIDIELFNGFILDAYAEYNKINLKGGSYNLLNGINYSGSIEKIYNIDKDSLNGFSKLKIKMLNVFRNKMPLSAGFCYAVLTGDTAYVNDSVLTDFRNTGTAHVFAVSGLHIGFLFSILSTLLKLLKVKNKHKFFIIAPLLLLYVAFCGFQTSCLRAFIIIASYTFAKSFGFKADNLSALLLSLVIVLIVKPFDLFSVGFQLSYAVYLSLILLARPFERTLNKILPTFLSKVLAPSIVAYLSSLPIMLDNFSSVSLFAYLFNVFIIPIISVAYFILFPFTVFALIFEFLQIILIVPDVILGALIFVVSKMDTGIFMLTGITFSLSAIPYYLIMFTHSGLINLSKRAKSTIVLILFITFIILFILINVI